MPAYRYYEKLKTVPSSSGIQKEIINLRNALPNDVVGRSVKLNVRIANTTR